MRAGLVALLRQQLGFELSLSAPVETNSPPASCYSAKAQTANQLAEQLRNRQMAKVLHRLSDQKPSKQGAIVGDMAKTATAPGV